MQPWVTPESPPAPAPGPRVGIYRPGPSPFDRRHQLRPLATFEIIDQAASFWRRNVGAVVAVTLVCTLPVQLLSGLACRSGTACAGARPSLLGAASQVSGGAVGTVVALAVLAGLAAQLAAATIAHLVTAERLGNRMGVGEAMQLAVRRFGATSVAWVLGHLLLLVSGIAVVGPLVVMPLLLVTTPAIAIERLGPVAGMRRSWRLGRQRFWPVLGVALASGLVATLLGLAFSALPLGLAIGPLGRLGWLLRPLAQQLQLLVDVPLTATAATLAYLDLRVRTEGLDLQIDAIRSFPTTEDAGALAG